MCLKEEGGRESPHITLKVGGTGSPHVKSQRTTFRSLFDRAYKGTVPLIEKSRASCGRFTPSFIPGGRW